MFARLVESRRSGERSAWGALFSTLAHTAVIAFAVFATAQARVEPPRQPDVVVWLNPPPEPATAAPAPITPKATVATPALSAISQIEVSTAPVDVTIDLSETNPVLPGVGAPTAFNDLSAGSVNAVASPDPFPAERVERQAFLRAGGLAPRYPNSLRAAGIEGQVTALFVVSETGRVEPSTVRFTRSDNGLFEDSVREALEQMRFIPAEVGGRKVRQLVQMPFVFTLTR